MIIQPIFAQPSPVSPNLVKGEDEFGKYIRRTKTVIGRNNNFVKSDIWFRPESHSLTKFNIVGNMAKCGIHNPNGNYNAEVTSSSYVTMNSDTGEIEQYGLQVPVPALNPVTDTNYFIGYTDDWDPLSPIGLFAQRTSVDEETASKSEVDIPINTADRFSTLKQSVYSCENIYQMYYHEFIGLIKSYFTSHMWNIPMDAYITIDCAHGVYNVQSFKIANVMSRDKMCEIYKKFLASVSDLTILLKRACEVNKRKFEVQIFIGNQNCIVKLRDLVHGAIISSGDVYDRYFLTNNDLSAEIMMNVISAGTGYLVSNSYDALSKHNSPVVDGIMDSTFFDMIDWREENIDDRL